MLQKKHCSELWETAYALTLSESEMWTSNQSDMFVLSTEREDSLALHKDLKQGESASSVKQSKRYRKSSEITEFLMDA